jgi:hypothetical protein
MRTDGVRLGQGMNTATRIQKELPVLSVLTQMIGLDLKQTGLHCRGAAQPPQDTG